MLESPHRVTHFQRHCLCYSHTLGRCSSIHSSYPLRANAVYICERQRGTMGHEIIPAGAVHTHHVVAGHVVRHRRGSLWEIKFDKNEVIFGSFHTCEYLLTIQIRPNTIVIATWYALMVRIGSSHSINVSLVNKSEQNLFRSRAV